MPVSVSKSRTFAVVLEVGSELGVYFVHKRTVQGKSNLEIESEATPWARGNKDALIELLRKGGLTVRFYDPEEKQWMDQSIAYGYVRAPGNRDGTWGPPVSVEDFEESYLGTV